MKAERTMSCALAIGGLDPGGGAGLAADLRAFTAAGAFGCAVAALLTVQSTGGLAQVVVLAPRFVLAQAREVVRHQRVTAIKVGALGSAANVRAVAGWLAENAAIPAIVDTPVLATRGKARLLAERAIGAVPRAALLTVNADEAALLTGGRVESLSEAHDAALALARLGARAALVKGGHLSSPRDRGTDVLVMDGHVTELRSKALALAPTHGTGCSFASLIAGRVAVRGLGHDTIRWAKRTHHAALEGARDVGGALRVLVF
jgi:hydroxymethylpyrimidine/phosphomethylpyrimidine kinase